MADTCPLCGKPSPKGAVHQYHYPPGAKRRASPKSDATSSKTNIVIVIGAVVAVLWLLGSFLGDSDDGSTSDGSGEFVVERTCEIFRDIAADYVDGVDTLAETRDRFKDLYDGYGQQVSSDLSAPLRGIVAALTTFDADALESSVGDMDSACSSRGY